MAQSKATSEERRAPPHHVLCVLPRQFSTNPLGKLLQGYELSTASTRTATLRLARNIAHDLYVLYAPLGWVDPSELCRRIREFDTQTPAILYSAQPSALERRETLAQRTIQAYVARSDDAHNLAATAGQLIMLVELRSMEAMRLELDAIQAHVEQRVARFAHARASSSDATAPRALARLKAEACGLFTSAGGSRANFERLWPSLYDAALKRCPPAR